MNTNKRLIREKKTVKCMIAIFCRGKHSPEQELCPECRELNNYAEQRVDLCRFGETKPVCAQCRIHCYKPEMRERIREVMRYSGPRMIWKHPVLTIVHMWDSWKRPHME